MAYLYMNKHRRGNGKHLSRVIKAINLGFATDQNRSAYKFYVPETRKFLLLNQARYDKTFFSYSTAKIIEQDKNDHLTNILCQVQSGATLVAYY